MGLSRNAHPKFGRFSRRPGTVRSTWISASCASGPSPIQLEERQRGGAGDAGRGPLLGPAMLRHSAVPLCCAASGARPSQVLGRSAGRPHIQCARTIGPPHRAPQTDRPRRSVSLSLLHRRTGWHVIVPAFAAVRPTPSVAFVACDSPVCWRSPGHSTLSAVTSGHPAHLGPRGRRTMSMRCNSGSPRPSVRAVTAWARLRRFRERSGIGRAAIALAGAFGRSQPSSKSFPRFLSRCGGSAGGGFGRG